MTVRGFGRSLGLGHAVGNADAAERGAGGEKPRITVELETHGVHEPGMAEAVLYHGGRIAVHPVKKRLGLDAEHALEIALGRQDELRVRLAERLASECAADERAQKDAARRRAAGEFLARERTRHQRTGFRFR